MRSPKTYFVPLTIVYMFVALLEEVTTKRWDELPAMTGVSNGAVNGRACSRTGKPQRLSLSCPEGCVTPLHDISQRSERPVMLTSMLCAMCAVSVVRSSAALGEGSAETIFRILTP